ncbi:MAG: hypothetical protein U0703_18355, partial [Anaerolineae bacterium]
QRVALLLFVGVPDRWLTPGADIGVEGFLTMYGDVSASLCVEQRTMQITVTGARAGTPISRWDSRWSRFVRTWKVQTRCR